MFSLYFSSIGRSTCNQQVASEHVIHKTSGYKEEDVALFSCEEGYMLLGESYITCLRTGEWSSTWPSCIQNGMVDVCVNTVFNLSHYTN